MEIVRLNNEITVHNVDEARMTIGRLVEADGARVIVDLSRVVIITTPGLGMLLQIHSAARNSGSKFVLACPQPMVRDTFARTQLDRILPIASTLDEAHAMLSAD